MSSIRKPKRIRIYGTDEKEYLFLVKGGEDLRLDQRIEQIFEVMNNMVSKNTFCLSQDIRIATYNVLPTICIYIYIYITYLLLYRLSRWLQISG